MHPFENRVPTSSGRYQKYIYSAITLPYVDVKGAIAQIAPPTINLNEPDEGCDLDYVPNTAKKMKIDGVLSNSFGFGGTNGTLVFKKIS